MAVNEITVKVGVQVAGAGQEKGRHKGGLVRAEFRA